VCGITGIYNIDNSLEVSEKTLVKMRDTLIHRGPDDEGTYISKDKKVGFGFRRLSIIDLSKAGNQPMLMKIKQFGWFLMEKSIIFRKLKKI